MCMYIYTHVYVIIYIYTYTHIYVITHMLLTRRLAAAVPAPHHYVALYMMRIDCMCFHIQ